MLCGDVQLQVVWSLAVFLAKAADITTPPIFVDRLVNPEGLLMPELLPAHTARVDNILVCLEVPLHGPARLEDLSALRA